MKRTKIITVIMLCILLCSCHREEVSLTLSSEEESESGEDIAAAESDPIAEEILVYICGAVKEPGVYTFAYESRVYQGILSAGGFTEDAAEGAVNLASYMEDGQQIRIPTKEEIDAGLYMEEQQNTGGADEDGLLDLNRAGKEDLLTLPGIGQSKADAILAYREAAGGFSAIEEIMQVDGIKSGTYNKIKDLITVK